jgi:hypothetical protein
MKSTATPLQQAYFTLLNGVVDNLYDAVPASPSYPYVQIDSRTAVEYNDKSSLGEEVTQTIWVVDRFANSPGSRLALNELADTVVGTIRTRPNAVEMFNWNVVTTTVDIDNFSRERTDTHTYYRREIRFRHHIEQLNFSLLTDDEGNLLTDDEGALLYA